MILNLKKFKKGFSLVEIMITCTVIAIVLVGMMKVFTNIKKGSLQAKYRTIGSNLAQEKLEYLKSFRFEELPLWVWGLSFGFETINVDNKQFWRWWEVEYGYEDPYTKVIYPGGSPGDLKWMVSEVWWNETEYPYWGYVAIEDYMVNQSITDPSGAIQGLVSNAGSPLSGALVRVIYPPLLDYSAISTGSASENYTLTKVKDGTYDVIASKAGYITGTCNSVTVTSGVPASGINFPLAAITTYSVSGTVYDLVGPRASATVYSNDGVSSEQTTGAAGGYTLPAVASGGPWIVRASAGSSMGSITISVSGNKTGVNITLLTGATAGTINGKVIAKGGASLSGANVSADDSDPATQNPNPQPSYTTGANGKYEFTDVLPGTAWTVTASKPGFTTGVQVTDVNPGETVTLPDFILVPIGSISGRVVDPANSPVPNINVTAKDLGYEVQASASSDSNGDYTMLNVPVYATYIVEPVVGNEYISNPVSQAPIAVTKGTDTHIANFVLSSLKGTISGNVKEGGKTITSGVRIYAVKAGSTINPGNTQTITAAFRNGTVVFYGVVSDSQGNFTVTVTAGVNYDIYAQYCRVVNSAPVLKQATNTNVPVESTTCNFNF